MTENRHLSWCFAFLFVAISVLPLWASAENLNLKSAKTNYNVGDSFTVSLTLDTKGQSVNTLSGIVVVPTSKLQILDVRYGNSIVTLWVERPAVSGGTITFTGGTPGGFSGSAGPILSFGLRAKAEGSAAISLKDIKILLNDGKGTELDATSGTLKLSISKVSPPKPALKPAPAAEEKPPETEVYALPPDTVSPESFIPLISNHPSIENNKYFVSFFAVDKDSGILYYEIRERPQILTLITTKFDKEPVRAETPYVLEGQYWAYKVTVRAYDQAGNFTEGYTIKPLSFVVVVALISALVFIAVLIRRYIYKSRRPPRRMV